MGIRILIPKPRRRTKGLRTRRFLWLAAGAAVWGIAYSVFGAGGLMGVYRTEADVERLRTQVEEARQVNEALQQRVDALRTDPQEIEREARTRLGLVREGDKVYLLPESPADEAEPTAEVYPLEVMTGFAQIFDQTDRLFERRTHRPELADLGSDMDVNADRFDARKRFDLVIQARGIRPWHAKLVASFTGRNIWVSARGYIRVHAQGDRRDFAQACGDVR